MTLFNYISDPNILSYGLFGGLTCYIVGSIIKNIWFADSFASTTLETPTTESGMDTIRAFSNLNPSPTLHYFNPDQLRSMIDLTTEGSPVETSWADKGVQTINENFEGITLNLNHSPISLDTTSIDFLNLESPSITGKVDNLAWLYPDHPNSLAWMVNNSVESIIANSQLFDNLNLFL